jgi:hypothetical protein
MDDDDDGRGGSIVGGMPKQDSKTMNLFWMYLSSAIMKSNFIQGSEDMVLFCIPNN